MTSFAFATSILSAAVLLLARPVDASSTEYKCSGGEYCEISSNGDMCAPIGQGLPIGIVFIPTFGIWGEFDIGESAPMPYDCIGIEGGEGCVVTCPGDCTVTPNVASPCGVVVDMDPDDDENNDMDMDPTSGTMGTKSIALASMMIGAVVAKMLL